MLLKILQTELTKLKRARVMWLVPVSALLPVLLSIAVLIVGGKMIFWDSIFKNTINITNYMVAPPLFALLAGYLFAREYQDNTINSLFAYPYSRLKIMLVKMSIMIPIIGATWILNYIFVITLSLLFPHQPIDLSYFIEIFKIYLMLIPLHFTLVPIAVSFGIVARNSIAPMSLGIGAAICQLLIMNTQYNNVYPWSIPFIFAANRLKMMTNVNYQTGVTTLLISFTIPLIFNLVYYNKSNVHAGR